MDWRARRRLYYLVLVLLVVAVAGGVFFWLNRPEPSCFDERRNQDEIGVDCGGSCVQVCSFEIQPLKIIWSQVFEVSPGKFDVASLVINPNANHGIQNLRYLTRLVDRTNLLITETAGQTFINPGETAVLFNTRLPVGQRQPARAYFDIAEPPVWQKMTAVAPRLEIRRQQFTAQPAPRLTAELVNRSTTDWREVRVVTVLSDQAKNAIAVSSTLVELLPAGAARTIVFTWPSALVAAPTTIDFYPRVDLTAAAP